MVFVVNADDSKCNFTHQFTTTNREKKVKLIISQGITPKDYQIATFLTAFFFIAFCIMFYSTSVYCGCHDLRQLETDTADETTAEENHAEV